MFRGEFDLQRAKQRLIKPQVIGVERVWLGQESTTASQSHAVGQNWSRGSAATKSSATTKSRSRAKGWSHIDSASTARSWAQSHSDSQSTASVDMTSEGESASSGTTTIPGTGSIEDALMLSGPQAVSYSDGRGASTAHTTGTVVSPTGAPAPHGRRLPIGRHGRQPFDVDRYRHGNHRRDVNDVLPAGRGQHLAGHRAGKHARPVRGFCSYIYGSGPATRGALRNKFISSPSPSPTCRRGRRGYAPAVSVPAASS